MSLNMQSKCFATLSLKPINKSTENFQINELKLNVKMKMTGN